MTSELCSIRTLQWESGFHGDPPENAFADKFSGTIADGAWSANHFAAFGDRRYHAYSTISLGKELVWPELLSLPFRQYQSDYDFDQDHSSVSQYQQHQMILTCDFPRVG